MQAIQRYHYERVKGYLNLLHREAEFYQLPEGHVLSINEQSKKIEDLFIKYRETLKVVEILIRQYDAEYNTVRRLMSIHKQHRKKLLKKNLLQPIPELGNNAEKPAMEKNIPSPHCLVVT